MHPLALILAAALALPPAQAATFCWDAVPGAPWYNIHRGRMTLVWSTDPETGEQLLTTGAPIFHRCDAVPVPASPYCTQGRCCAQALDVAPAELALEFLTAIDPDAPGSESRNGGLTDTVQVCP